MGQIKRIHEMLVNKEISCVELTKKYLDAIENSNKELNAYITVTPDVALAQAEAVDKKLANGEEIGLLEGIPMTLKDNISTKGIETTCASKILTGYKPIYDATVYELLLDQGVVMLGKTNMDEFAMGSSCETSYYGGAKNPHSLDHVSGGSSGGVASAVGANLAVYGLGSDTGGSIRQPASFCGIVGLKPTYGAVSRYGLIAYASSFDQIGPITHDVEDAAIVFDAIAKYDERDSTSQGSEPALPTLDDDIKGKRIGIAREYLDGVREDVKQAVLDAAKAYEDMGAEIVWFDLPELKFALPCYYILAMAEASSNLGRYDGIRYGYKAEHYNGTHDMICRTRSEGFGKEVQRRILMGTYVLSAGYYDAYYKKAVNLRGAIVDAFDRAFEKCDVILAPTAPVTAFKNGYLFGEETDQIEQYLSDICTVPVNAAGLPGVSLPCGVDAEGLPIGMQLIGKKFDEKTILNLAYKYEQAENKYIETKWGVKL
nr:Asp-tRNA(Asn)/Glu-tRNA(Gln) amidotransferase subunit GatA [uncultured Ruminococcus sp.]